MIFSEDFILRYGHTGQLIAFIILFVGIWNFENIRGFLMHYSKWRHAFANAPFSLSNLPGQIVLGLLFIKVTDWCASNQFGLLYLLSDNIKPSYWFLLSFIMLDFGEYVYHILMHRVKRLWMFHIVHHSDTVVDVSTTLREHPGENFIRLSFTLCWVFLSGTMLWMIILRQLIQVFSTLFAHMNYRLPERADKIIGLIFITPNLHQVHHHYKQPYTDCNFGDVLSIWDRCFGTFKRLPSSELKFGVDTYPDEKETGSFFSLIKLPFGKYRSAEK